MHLPRIALTLVILGCVILPACSSKSSPPAAATIDLQVPIDSQNAEEVARTGFDAAFDVLTVARNASFYLSTPPVLPPAGAAAVIPSQTLFGPEGGQVLFTWEDRDGSADHSSGDVFSLEFEGYGELGLLLDGMVVFEDLSIQANPVTGAFWTIKGTMRCLNLDIAQSLGGPAQLLNGSLLLERESRAFTILTTVTMLDDFVYRGNRILAGSTMRWDDYRNLTCAWFADGAVDSPALGGTFEFRTRRPLTGYNFFPLPNLGPAYGNLEVFGANGTRVQVLPRDDYSSLDLAQFADGLGDDEADEPATVVATTWFEFKSDV